MMDADCLQTRLLCGMFCRRKIYLVIFVMENFSS